MRSSVLIQALEHADDVALVSNSLDALEEVLRSLDVVCSGLGLFINSRKTKLLAILHSTPCGIQPCGVQLKPEKEPVTI